MLRKKFSKKSQEAGGGSAAVFVAVIAFMIILYILFLPPDERAQILGGDGSSSSDDYVPDYDDIDEDDDDADEDEDILLLENPGMLSVHGDDRIYHFIQKVRLFDEWSGTVLEEHRAVSVKRSLFDNEPELLILRLDDFENTKSLLIDFVIKKSVGDLMIKFNEEAVFDGYLTEGTIEPISIRNDLLKKNNLIEFIVSSPGLRFWRTNQYYLENIKAIGTIRDVSHMITKEKFFISDDEYDSAEKIELKYYPYCDSKKIGPLTIKVNDQEIYSGTPYCNAERTVEFGPEIINKGDNNIEFSTTKGSYEINKITIEAEVDKKEDYSYYFDLDEDYFMEVAEGRCGDVDDICPAGCSEDEDIDCCFGAGSDNYWCDLEPSNVDNRCVTDVEDNECGLCLTGYEDEYGYPHDSCEGLCGDDTDDLCHSGCNKNYDKDCCYVDDSDNYWCDYVPDAGLSSVCEDSISSGECDDCLTNYKNENKDIPIICDRYPSGKYKLKKGYKVLLDFKFLDDDKEKKFELNINGRKDMIRTDDDTESKDISSKVRRNYNSLLIKPEKSFEIAEIKVTLEKN